MLATLHAHPELVLGLAIVSHRLLEDEHALVTALVLGGDAQLAWRLDFVREWVRHGRPLPQLELERLLQWVRACPDSSRRTGCEQIILAALDFFSPVLARWIPKVTPDEHPFVWMDWDAKEVARALTSLCMPFFRLRPCEFDEKAPGKHLKELNLRYRALASFVLQNVLQAVNSSTALGCVVCKCAAHLVVDRGAASSALNTGWRWPRP